MIDDIQAIIFDFDGVILESADIKTGAFVELFADYPQHQPAILRHHLDNLGISRYTKFEWIYRELLQRPYGEVEQAKLGQEFSAIVMDRILRCPAVPGALEALEALHGRLPLFVASGTPQEELAHILQQRDLAGYFTEALGTPRNKREIISDILARYGWRPEQVLMVGDGMSDYQAAAAVGLPFWARITAGCRDQWAALGVVGAADLHCLMSVIEVTAGDWLDTSINSGG
jgi:phosphoglycolate phosphatase-like HAD superfamily hydrolase